MKRGPKIALLLLLTLASLYGCYRLSLRLAIDGHLRALRARGLPVTTEDLLKRHPAPTGLIAFLNGTAEREEAAAFVRQLVARQNERLGRALAVSTNWPSGGDYLGLAWESARSDDPKQAVAALQDWLAFRQAVDQCPGFICIRTVWTESADFAAVLQELLDRGRLSDGQLVSLSQAIQAVQKQHGPDFWLETVAVERVLTHEDLGKTRGELAQAIGCSERWNPVLQLLAVDEYNQLIALEAWRTIEQAGAQPFPQAWPLVITVQNDYAHRPLRVKESKLQYASPFIHWHLQHPTYMNLALTGIAAERHRRAQGKWPASLADLVPDYLPAVPLDPFSGLALQSKTASNQFIAFSVGVQAPFVDAEEALIALTIQQPPR